MNQNELYANILNSLVARRQLVTTDLKESNELKAAFLAEHAANEKQLKDELKDLDKDIAKFQQRVGATPAETDPNQAELTDDGEVKTPAPRYTEYVPITPKANETPAEKRKRQRDDKKAREAFVPQLIEE